MHPAHCGTGSMTLCCESYIPGQSSNTRRRAHSRKGRSMICRILLRLSPLALVVSLTLPSATLAQGVIRGTVTDRTTGEAIAGAQVSSGAGDVAAVSDVSGAFVLTSRSPVQSVTV